MAHVATEEESRKQKDLLQLAAFLIVLQFADGILTVMGVSAAGLAMEGNILLRYFMYKIGLIPTITLAKLAAIIITIALVKISSELTWIRKAFGGIAFVYLFAAIFPWTYFLMSISVGN